MPSGLRQAIPGLPVVSRHHRYRCDDVAVLPILFLVRHLSLLDALRAPAGDSWFAGC